MTTTMTTTAPSDITYAQWRQLILPIAEEIIEEETHEFDWLNEDNGDTAGVQVFNGLLFEHYFNWDSEVFAKYQVFDERMKRIYNNEFKAFLNLHNIDPVDMYIYFLEEIDNQGYDPLENRSKENHMASWFMHILDEYQEDFIEADEDATTAGDRKMGVQRPLCFTKFQALWRGHDARWKTPVFTFNED